MRVCIPVTDMPSRNTKKYEKLPVSVLENYPEADEEQVNTLFLQELKLFQRKLVVLDDDPTGVQTVHDVSVYTDWKEESLLCGIQENNSLFFVLTNSRSFTKEQTERTQAFGATAGQGGSKKRKGFSAGIQGRFYPEGALSVGAGDFEGHTGKRNRKKNPRKISCGGCCLYYAFSAETTGV